LQFQHSQSENNAGFVEPASSINRLYWTKKGADMNPVENLLGYLVCSLNKAHNSDGVRCHARDARNNDELFQFVSEKLNDLTVKGEYREKLVDSMPWRL
jgi:hypothetical protein